MSKLCIILHKNGYDERIFHLNSREDILMLKITLIAYEYFNRHPLFRHALIQAVRYSLPQFMKQLRLMSFMSVWKMGRPSVTRFKFTGCFRFLCSVRAQYPAIPIIVVSAHEELFSVQLRMARWVIFLNRQSYWWSDSSSFRWRNLVALPSNLNLDPRAADETALAFSL